MSPKIIANDNDAGSVAFFREINELNRIDAEALRIAEEILIAADDHEGTVIAIWHRIGRELGLGTDGPNRPEAA